VPKRPAAAKSLFLALTRGSVIASEAKQSLGAQDNSTLGQKLRLFAQLGLPAFVGINISTRPALLKDCHKADFTKEDYEVKWGKTERKGNNELRRKSTHHSRL